MGLLACQVDGDNMEGFHKPGLFAGLYVNKNLSDKFSLQMEMDYFQKGCKANNLREDKSPNTYHLTLHQIGIPILLDWNCSKNIYLNAGVAFCFTPLIREKREGELLEFPEDKYYFFELAGIAGLRYEINYNWSAGLRFNYSLLPIGKSYYRKIGLRNNVLQLYAAYKFK